MNIHRTNTLFYNKHVFAKLGVAPPSTLDELRAVIDAAKSHRVAPLALGWRDPWTLTHLAFENVMVAVAGGTYYREFFDGARSPRDDQVRTVLEELTRLVAASNEGGQVMSWQDAADLLGSGQAAMMVMGDWAKAYLASSGWRIGVDFGQVPMPGTRGAFVFATDTFGLPKTTDGRAPAIDLLKVFGSEAGQTTFNLIKGSIPARADVDLSNYDVLARRTARDFAESVRYPGVTSLAPASFLRVVDRALARFALGGSADACIATLREHYDWLRSRVC
jgi:glucose/mannose transport system substrate-binding protein